MVYRQYGFQVTPHKENGIEQRGANKKRHNKRKLWKAHDNWNDWKFQLHCNNIE